MSSRKLGLACTLLLAACAAHATLPPWLQHVVGSSTAESALYRLMHLPGADVLYPRPPREAQAELGKLPLEANLYALKARADEQALDETAAEGDWRAYAERANTPEAKLELADFYGRRLEPAKEIPVLTEVASAPAQADELYVASNRQRSWRVFNRLFALEADQDLPAAARLATMDAFLHRFPTEPAAYGRALDFALERRDFGAAEALIARYRQRNPAEQAFPLRASAQLAASRDGAAEALAVYDRAFQPLWPRDLVKAYLNLLEQNHAQRLFVATARASLATDPDGPHALNALARIFFYDLEAGRTPQALQTLDRFRIDREARGKTWTAEDLYTLGALSTMANSPSEAARYNFALASASGTVPGGEAAAQSGLAALTHLLLASPDQPLALGAGNLTLYRDIATLDSGPGYWNGILSLWLNGTSPASEYSSETGKAQAYFHRSKAAELLAELDAKYPSAPERAGLHAELIAGEAQYGEPAAVIAEGKRFLLDFPTHRVEVASLMADAYARQNDSKDEFALYDSLLAELAAQSAGQPLTAAAPASGASETFSPLPSAAATALDDMPVRPTLPAATEYRQVLDRYLARLVATRQLMEALRLLRRELDRNPGDPLLYERLATFLQQNNLSEAEEEVYRQAFTKFQQPTYYDRLARLYLREKKREAFAALTRQVVDVFSGTEVDEYFATVSATDADTAAGPQLALKLNLYAAKRFPHDLVFTRNLLAAYGTAPTLNPAAYEALLRQAWFASDDLRDQFFALLSRTGRLDAELAQLNPKTPEANPAALEEYAELSVWTSHFEGAAAPFRTLAALYPANPALDDRAVSIFRSLSYNDPTPASLDEAVLIERNLLRAEPDSPDRLATLGDLYAEVTATAGEDLGSASPFWRQIPGLHPGTPAGSLTSATIFWDYFQFDDALGQIAAARKRFASPTLFGYQAGAIEENRHNLPAAVREYTGEVVEPLSQELFLHAVDAAVGALERAPSDAADSNLQSTAEDLFNSAEARARLLQLARRPAAARLVDEATSAAVLSTPTPEALSLRADVLLAEHRQGELPALLRSALARAQTADQAAAIGDLAREHSAAASPGGESMLREVDVELGPDRKVTKQFAPSPSYALVEVYESALHRQVELSADPVTKIQLQYALAASLEGRRQVAAATAVIDAVYKLNPRVLGVVRATTDFYARTGQPPRAIATLLEAAAVATPQLRHDFTLEAATRANESGDPAQARQLALSLLPAVPYDAPVLAVVAASYARQNDNAGLKTFYLARLEAARTAPDLTRDERREDIALLRRGLIPALTRMQDYAGAEDQYIALLSAFPDDSATAAEAALYALRYKRQAQLAGFLESTVRQSPHDSRFAILLAQVETTFEDLPAALRAYDAAITIRKDRVDLYQARSTLELQLAQANGEPDPALLDRAAADFARLYALSYHDPQWQVRLAEVRAREGRIPEAVAALRIAYIEGHASTGPLASINAFTVATQLERWNLLPEARTFAELGVKLAGSNLLTATESGASTYARILTRLGKPDEALGNLNAARHSALALNPSTASLQAAPSGSTAAPSTEDTDSADASSGKDAEAIRKNLLAQRRQTIESNLQAAVRAIGQTVQTFYTPEQTASYGAVLDSLHTADAALALHAASAAGLAAREAAWRREQLLAAPGSSEDLAVYTALEQQRLAFAELAGTLEAYSARVAPKARPGIRSQLAAAYADAGDTASEIRLMRPADLAAPEDRDHFFGLLLEKNPAALLSYASGGDKGLADAAVNYTVAHGTLEQSSAMLAARGKALGALWTNANLALVNVYLAPHTDSAFSRRPAVVTLFDGVLRASDTIAQRLGGTAAAPSLQGDLWFSVASRFGLYLNLPPAAPDADDALAPEDFLAADLELSPSNPEGYRALAQTYAEAGNLPAAKAEYAHVFELDTDGEAALQAEDELALVLDRSGDHAGALAHWRSALDVLRRMQDRGSYPARFFTSFVSVLAHTGERHLDVRAEIESILRPYLAHNGNYRSNELLQAAYGACATPVEGAALLVSLSSAASDADEVLRDIESASWLSPAARLAILEQRLELARRPPVASSGEAPSYREGQLLALEGRLVAAEIALGDFTHAQNLLDSIPAASIETNSSLVQSRLLLAAHAGTLAALLDALRSNAEPPTEPGPFLSAARSLSSAKASPADLRNARSLREFVFETKGQNHALVPTDFLSLAESRLATGDLPGALVLLHRLSLLPPATPVSPGAFDENSSVDRDPNSNLDAAAALLESSGHPAEAVAFLRILAASAPWNATYKLRLLEASGTSSAGAAGLLAALAADPQAPYAARVRAAQDLAKSGAAATPDLGSAELNLLAHPGITAASARQPGFLAARLAVAALSGTAAADRIVLLGEAIAASPEGPVADRARLDLFLAETSDSTPPSGGTLALLRILEVPAQSYAQTAASADAESDDSSASSDVAATGEDDSTYGSSGVSPLANLPGVAASLSLPAQIQLGETLSRIASRSSDTRAQAVAYLQLALSLDAASVHPDTSLPGRLAALKAQIALAAANAARRPVFHQELDQKHDVRPCLSLAEAARFSISTPAKEAE